MEDDNYIPLSYISQYFYCKRRAALLMLEQQWNESADTIKGSEEHKNVHTEKIEKRGSIHYIYDMTVVSKQLNLYGKCDLVEAHQYENGVNLPFIGPDRYALYPIEYKHGKLRDELEYELQLCAQAMCLEEMYGLNIECGDLFYISSHRKTKVLFDDSKRRNVCNIAKELSEMLKENTIPKGEYSKKCVKCSLKEICLPNINGSVIGYMEKINSYFDSEEL